MLDSASKAARGAAVGEAVSARTRVALERLRAREPDERRAARALGISRSTYARSLAGLGLRRGSVALIEGQLRALGLYDAEAAAEAAKRASR